MKPWNGTTYVTAIDSVRRTPRDEQELVISKRRTFTSEFERQLVEELLSAVSRPAHICRRHDISSSLLYRQEKFPGKPSQVAAIQESIQQLEWQAGKLTLENEFLVRRLQNAVGKCHKMLADRNVRVGFLTSHSGGLQSEAASFAAGLPPSNEFEELLQITPNGVPTRQTALTYSVQT